MDPEKQALINAAARPEPQTRPKRPRWGMTKDRRVVIAATIVGYIWLFGSFLWSSESPMYRGSSTNPFDRPVDMSSSSSSSSSSSRRVPFEAHIMSKCPDARDCLKEMILPVMPRVIDMVDFRLTYIGQAAENGSSVTCMHGSDECTGNMIELCAAHLYPDPKIYLGFTMCLSQNYRDIPQDELVSECALEHSIEQNALGECMLKDDGKFATGLLVDSVRRSNDAKVRFSCSVRIDDKLRCVRDGGQWKDCEGGSEVTDILRDIEALYEERNA